MINHFQDNYDNRLRSWRDLRQLVSNSSLPKACVEIDEWWQRAPIINHHLHWNDAGNWPDPWTMLSENEYCTLTRAIGMCYTLLMCGIEDIRLVTATDNQCEEHNLVLVGGAKYILNYWPNSVLNTPLSEFTVVRDISIETIRNKIK